MSNVKHLIRGVGAFLVLAGATLWASTAQSQVLTLSLPIPIDRNMAAIHRDVLTDRTGPDDSAIASDASASLRRQIVDYSTVEAPGTVIIDTPNTYLYFVLGGGKAVRYGIGIGREGFTWSGVKTIERKSEWPDWFPPTEMLQRQPYLPRFMAGGPGNPLGARAMYLGGTVYRIHGTNAPDTIGQQVSSGCIRMVNDDVIDLYDRTSVGTKVVVLPMDQSHIAQAQLPAAAPVRATSSRIHVSSLYRAAQ